MLIKTFQQETIGAPRPTVCFRGRESYFWKRRIFKNSPQLEPDSKEFDFLILFDPAMFLAIEPKGMEEIVAHLDHSDPDRENIFSIEGKPFFAISRQSFKKLKLDLQNDKNLLLKLQENRNVRLLSIDHRYTILDLTTDFRMIENMVIIHQVEELIAGGVIIEDIGNFYVEGMPSIGEGSRLTTGVVVKGNSSVGKNSTIYPHCYIENSQIGDSCTLLPGCVLRDSALEENVTIGPYAHLRNGALAKKDAKMGNFVEMKKSVLGEGSKAMHLSYIGDAEVGKKVNIGAGTITCNYDGVNKNKTTIQDGVFIGSGSQLIAPVTIEKNGYVAAGSTITDQVPENSLAVARHKQRNILDWVTRKNRKKV